LKNTELKNSPKQGKKKFNFSGKGRKENNEDEIKQEYRCPIF